LKGVIALRHPLYVVFLRAALLWALAWMLLFVVSRLAFPTEPPEPNPLGTVLACQSLGVVDIRRRGERALWANLGYPSVIVIGMYGLAALAGELTIAVLRG
jgi:hypothetical protein